MRDQRSQTLTQGLLFNRGRRSQRSVSNVSKIRQRPEKEGQQERRSPNRQTGESHSSWTVWQAAEGEWGFYTVVTRWKLPLQVSLLWQEGCGYGQSTLWQVQQPGSSNLIYTISDWWFFRLWYKGQGLLCRHWATKTKCLLTGTQARVGTSGEVQHGRQICWGIDKCSGKNRQRSRKANKDPKLWNWKNPKEGLGKADIMLQSYAHENRTS